MLSIPKYPEQSAPHFPAIFLPSMLCVLAPCADLGMAEVLAVCLSEKADEGQSASGMRGIFSTVRALEDMCIVPPFVGAIHRRIAGGGGGAKQGA